MDFKSSFISVSFIACQAFRVYYDRLVDDADRGLVFGFMRKVVESELKENFDALFITLDFDGDGKVTEDDLRSLMFCDFSNVNDNQKSYIEVKDIGELGVVVEGHLEEYNTMNKKTMNLVMFRSVIEPILGYSFSV